MGLKPFVSKGWLCSAISGGGETQLISEIEKRVPIGSDHKEINKGLEGFKSLLKIILEEGDKIGELNTYMEKDAIVEIVLGGMLDTSVL